MVLKQIVNKPLSILIVIILVIVSIVSSCKKEENSTINGLLIKISPEQVTGYIAGDKLNLSGLVVRLKMDNGITEDVELSNFNNKGIVCTPADGSILTTSISEVQIKHTDTGELTKQPIDVGVIKDFDGNSYKIVTIGNQVWTAENLRVTHFPDGTLIPLIADNIEWSNVEDNDNGIAYCYYNNDESNANKFGALYTYPAAKKACPKGWHIPSIEEWDEMESFIINDFSADSVAIALQATTEWKILKGINKYGFTALPGGNRDAKTGMFREKGMRADWWSNTTDPAMDIKNRYCYLYYLDSEMLQEGRCKSYGHSVRYIRD